MRPVASFRDPAGFCFALGDRILRIVACESAADLNAFLGSPVARAALSARSVVATRQLDGAELQRLREASGFSDVAAGRAVEAVFEHERIAFPSYPHEWPAEMLAAAGGLTLDLAEGSLAEGFGLKDATPGNILFRGPQPVFVDLLSFERRAPDDPVWKPDAQFQRTFLLPLLAHQRFGARLADIFTTRRDGLEPEEIFRLVGTVQKFLPPFLPLVSMPVWLGRKASGGGGSSLYQERRVGDPEKARFILGARFRGLRRQLARLQPAPDARSTWSGYMEEHSYEREAFAAKEQFVNDALHEVKPARALDVGANTGYFSALAARAGAEVVAVDLDAACVGRIWQRARAESLDILPLVVDLGRPSPALGWRNQECPSFLDRARGRFDAVLMLAVLHHLLVTERVPLDDVIDLAAELTRDALIIEFVAPQDEMFRRLARGRDDLFVKLDAAAFAASARRRFHIVRQSRLGNANRTLYLLRKRAD